MEKSSRIARCLAPQKGSDTMTTDDNKALVQRFFDEVINQRNLPALSG